MSALSSIVLPIFALVAAGWIARRQELLGPTAALELNRFVVYLGIPALLFQVLAKASWKELDQPGFTSAFGLGCAAIFFLAVLRRRLQRRSLADASLDGLNAGYANVGFIGFPLCTAAFGASSTPLVTITAIITVCILFGVAIMLVEIELNDSGTLAGVVRKVALSLVKNPILVAPTLGAIYGAFAPALPEGPDRFLSLIV
jgi:malonate transporter and related proteins